MGFCLWPMTIKVSLINYCLGWGNGLLNRNYLLTGQVIAYYVTTNILSVAVSFKWYAVLLIVVCVFVNDMMVILGKVCSQVKFY